VTPSDDPIVVVLNRDLRVHDHPALAAALSASVRVVPLFVLDPTVLDGPFAAPNRVGFLVDSLRDLRRSLRERSGTLFVRSGDPVEESLRVAHEVGARAIHASADVGSHAQRRERRFAEACAEARLGLRTFPGVTVVPPGEVRPSQGGDAYRVFTPYWRAWRAHPWRPLAATPRRVPVPTGLAAGRIPAWHRLVGGDRSPAVAPGGETAGRLRLRRWSASSHDDDGRRDDLAADATSRLSPYLHFGCLSPLEVATRIGDQRGGEPVVRQVCWRDFHHQVTADHPRMSSVELRPRGDRWRGESEELDAWREGLTGYPIVDAGMRQLRHEGWMHNRARLITASFLTKHLYVDWRRGADWFLRWLVDGDIANNSANWQWVAGTGTDTRPNRVLNPLRQADRYDPEGEYVRRWVPELADLDGRSIHRPWLRHGPWSEAAGYPDRLVDLDDAAAAFRARRG